MRRRAGVPGRRADVRAEGARIGDRRRPRGRLPTLESDGLYATLGEYGWKLATELLDADEIALADYLPERLAEVDAMGKERGHLMRFWASPDEPWFWRVVGPLDHVVLVTDHPAEAGAFLDEL